MSLKTIPAELSKFAEENRLDIESDKYRAGGFILKCQKCHEEVWFRSVSHEGAMFYYDEQDGFRNGKMNLNDCETELVCQCDDTRALPENYEVAW